MMWWFQPAFPGATTERGSQPGRVTTLSDGHGTTASTPRLGAATAIDEKRSEPTASHRRIGASRSM
jgi:hypothetical protein